MIDILAGWCGASDDAVSVAASIVKGVHPQVSEALNQAQKTDFFSGTCLSTNVLVAKQGDSTLLIQGKPRWQGNSDTSSLVESALTAYRHEGNTFIRKLTGVFSVLLFDAEQKKVLLAVDRIGQKSLYYSAGDAGLVFGSRADIVVAHPRVKREISPQAIYDYVYFHFCPSPGSIFKGVNKLEGGQLICFQHGEVTSERYWMPEFHEQTALSPEDAGERLKEIFIGSVADLAGDAETTGAFLSGGLDSSSVAGALSLAQRGEAKTFSIGFSEKKYNELDFAHIAVKHFGTKQHEYILEPDEAVAAIHDIAVFYDEPFGNSSALPAYFCARMAKDNGVTTLLAGDGGDEIYAGNERYVRQLLFEDYKKIPLPLRATLSASIKYFPKIYAATSLGAKAKRYVEQADSHLPERLQDYNFLHRHPASEVFSQGFLQQVDTDSPLRAQRSCYHRPEKASALNRMLYLDWKFTLQDNDLVKVNGMCELAGVQVAYPMLSDEMIDFSTQIPSDIKLKKRELRWFYKHAMRDFLPEAIINKEKHGFGLPFGMWLETHQPLRVLAYDSVDSLKKRGYFSADFLDHTIHMHKTVHAAYYGELIWVLMMLEIWLQNFDATQSTQ